MNDSPAVNGAPDSHISDEEDGCVEALRPLRPGLIPSAALTQKVAALAALADTARATSGETAQRHSRPRPTNQLSLRRLLLALSASVVIAGAIITATTLAPKIALANTLRAVSANLRRAEGVHYRITFFRRGKETLSQEIWQRGSRWRLESQQNGVRFIQIHADGKFWNYDPARKSATYQSDTGPSPFSQSAQSFQAFQVQAQQALENGRGEDLGPTTRGGRTLQRIAVPSLVQRTPFSAPVPGRTLFSIDRSRMLPVLTEQQVQENKRWTTVVQAELDLEHDVALGLFAIDEKNVRVYDLGSYGAQAGNRFAHPIASKRFATRTVTIRDVQVNRDGDLFILYADGSTPKQRRLIYPSDIRDDRGTIYTGTAGALEPFMYHQKPQWSRGMVVGGEVMQGICLVPLTPVTPLPPSALPRNVTLTFAFTERQGKKTFSGRARFTVPVRRTRSLLPSYAADLATLMLAGGEEEEFKQTREDGRRTHYFNANDWAGMIQTTDRAIAQGVEDVNTYLSRVTAFQKLGKPEQAEQSLTAARALDESGFYTDQIAQAEEELRKPR